MPIEDGYSLIQKIRKRGPYNGGNTPAVALTAYADLQTRQKALMQVFKRISQNLSTPMNWCGRFWRLKKLLTDCIFLDTQV